MDELWPTPADNTHGSVAIHKSLLTTRISYLPTYLCHFHKISNICPLVKWPLEFDIDVKFAAQI